MSALTEYVHFAIAETHPDAFASHSYMFCLDEDGTPYMGTWDEDRLGPLDLAAIEARCEQIALKGVVPTKVTRAQALMALHKAGLLPQVKDAVAAHPLEEVRIWFANSLNWERNNPYVLAIGMELELTDDQIDDLFIAASKEGV